MAKLTPEEIASLNAGEEQPYKPVKMSPEEIAALNEGDPVAQVDKPKSLKQLSDEITLDLEKRQAPTSSGTFFENIANTLTIGHLPQIKAKLPLSEKIRYIMNAPIGEVFTGEAFDKAKQAGKGSEVLPYVQRRDQESKLLQESAQKYPMDALAGNLIGAFSPGGVNTLFTKLAPVKDAGTFKKILTSAGLGGLYAGLYNPGEKEGEVDTLQLQERLKNAYEGAKLGGAVQGGISAAGGLSDFLKSTGKQFAYKQLGGILKDIKKVGKKNIEALGEQAINENIVGYIPKGAEAIEAKATEFKKQAGLVIGQMNKAASDAGAVVKTKDLVRNLLGSEVNRTLTGDPKYNDYVRERLRFIIKKSKNGTIDIQQGQALKEELFNRLKNNNIFLKQKMGNLTKNDKFDLALHKELKNALNNKVDEFANKFKDAKIQDFRNKYRAASTMEDLLEQKYARETGNNIFGLSNLLAGGFGGAATFNKEDPIGSTLKGVGYGLATKFGGQRLYGPTGKAMYKSGKAIPDLQPIAPALIRFLNQLQQSKQQQGAQ